MTRIMQIGNLWINHQLACFFFFFSREGTLKLHALCVQCSAWFLIRIAIRKGCESTGRTKASQTDGVFNCTKPEKIVPLPWQGGNVEGGCFEGGNMVEVMFFVSQATSWFERAKREGERQSGKRRRKSGRVVPSSLLQAWTDQLIPLLIDGSAVACPSLVLVMTSSLPKYFVKLQYRVPTLWINTSEIHQWANNPFVMEGGH